MVKADGGTKLGQSLALALEDAVERGIILTDGRQRLTRVGKLAALSVVRLNRRHPAVRELLQIDFGRS